MEVLVDFSALGGFRLSFLGCDKLFEICCLVGYYKCSIVTDATSHIHFAQYVTSRRDEG
jgi:hypothetical protein